MLELLFPAACAGCGRPGTVFCARCQRTLLAPPQRVTPLVQLPVPAYAFGQYTGCYRNLVLGMKEKGRRDVIPHVGAVLRSGLRWLCARELLPAQFVLVPAPTTQAAMRSRGGDIVTGFCQASGFFTQCLVRKKAGGPDSVELTMVQRMDRFEQLEILGKTALPIVIVDDVLTTGKTLLQTSQTLLGQGMDVVAAVTFCVA